MAISFVGSKTFSAAGAASGTFSVSLTDLKDTGGSNATVAQNDLVIICYATGAASDRAFTEPSGYTEDAETYSNDTVDTNLCAWRKFMGAITDTTVDIPKSGSTSEAADGTIFAFRGVDTSTPLDVAVQTATGIDAGQPNPASITPTTSGAWVVVIGGAGHATAAVFTNPGDLSSTQIISSLSHLPTPALRQRGAASRPIGHRARLTRRNGPGEQPERAIAGRLSPMRSDPQAQQAKG